MHDVYNLSTKISDRMQLAVKSFLNTAIEERFH